MDTKITLGDLVGAISVLLAIFTFLYTWQKDRILKKKEYADKIRLASANTIAILERRKELLLSFFESIQPIITDAGIKLYKEKDVIETRDFLWREFSRIHNETKGKILDEKIETSYVDLYSYDSEVKKGFDEVMQKQKEIDSELIDEVLTKTQDNVMSFSKEENLKSAQLGNKLRSTCFNIKIKYGIKIETINSKFNQSVEKIIFAKDQEVYNKKITIKF